MTGAELLEQVRKMLPFGQMYLLNGCVLLTQAEAEDIARRFHEAYERLAPRFGYKTRDESAVPWEQVPEQNKMLMIATVREAVLEPKT